MKKGTDLTKIFYIDTTNAGCPRLRFQKVGYKGVTSIEVTSTGKTFDSTGRIKEVRVRGKNDKGNLFELNIKGAYLWVSEDLQKQYNEEGQKFLNEYERFINHHSDIMEKHDSYITKTQNKLWRLHNRTLGNRDNLQTNS